MWRCRLHFLFLEQYHPGRSMHLKGLVCTWEVCLWELNGHCGTANLGLRGIFDRIYAEEQYTLLHTCTKHLRCGPYGFREKDLDFYLLYVSRKVLAPGAGLVCNTGTRLGTHRQ